MFSNKKIINKNEIKKLGDGGAIVLDLFYLFDVFITRKYLM